MLVCSHMCEHFSRVYFFDTSVPKISMHISNILKEGELEPNSVVKDYLATAADGNC
jgi:hypothetical protein